MRRLFLLAVLAGAAAGDGIDRARAIAKAGPEAARDAIPEMIALGKGSPLERFAARDALAVAGPPAAAALIEGAAGDATLRLLLEGVSHDLGAGVVAPALPLLRSEDPKVRAAAAISLGAAGKGGEAAVKHLIEALHDKDADVRRESANALGGVGRGAHDAIPGLIHLANDPERGCTREALLALGRIVRDAAERDRPRPKPSPEVAAAIGRGLAWLARQQTPDGWWAVPGDAPGKARAHVAALALLAMLEGGAPAANTRAGLRFVVAADASAGSYPPGASRDAVLAALRASARVLDEPECAAAADRASVRSALVEGTTIPLAWHAVATLEARFAGLPGERGVLAVGDAGAIISALLGLAAGQDPRSDELRRLIESCSATLEEPEWWALAARARMYGGLKSPAILEATLEAQREDGSWDAPGNPLGPVHTTACMLLALEAASGLAHPLTMPLPDAPHLKAAVATLRLAAQSKDDGIRAAAEQALAGFR